MEDLIKKRMNVADANGWYLAEHATRKWMEDFNDEDTGEVVSIERAEIIAPMGDQLTPITISMLQANGVDEAFVSNVKITGTQQKYMSLWQLECITFNPLTGKEITDNYIIPKGSPLECEVFFKKWADLNVKGRYTIKKIVPMDFNGVLLPFDGEAEDAAKKRIDLYFYKATVKPDEGSPRRYLVLANNVFTVDGEVTQRYKYSDDDRITEIKEMNLTKFFEEGVTVENYALAGYDPRLSGDGFLAAARKAIGKALDGENVTVEVTIPEDTTVTVERSE
jgi:hypothetical protein